MCCSLNTETTTASHIIIPAAQHASRDGAAVTVCCHGGVALNEHGAQAGGPGEVACEGTAVKSGSMLTVVFQNPTLSPKFLKTDMTDFLDHFILNTNYESHLSD